MGLKISDKVREKIFVRHRLSEREIRQCFRNRLGDNLIDDREEHKTDPPTEWFLGKTSASEVVKILFINKGGDLHVKSAFPPSPECVELYRRTLGLSEQFLDED